MKATNSKILITKPKNYRIQSMCITFRTAAIQPSEYTLYNMYCVEIPKVLILFSTIHKPYLVETTFFPKGKYFLIREK